MVRSHVLVCGGTGCTSSGSNKLIDEFRMELTDKSNLRYPRTDLWVLFDEINEALSKIAGKDKNLATITFAFEQSFAIANAKSWVNPW